MKTCPRHARPVLLAALTLAAAALALPLGGCYTSQDKYPFTSTTWSPKTVVLIDTRTEEELWRYDAPVGTKLTLRFFSGDEDNLIYPDEMRWEITSTIGTSFKDSGELPCPPEGVRRVDWYERAKPEYPRPDAPEGVPGELPEAGETPTEAPMEEPTEG